MPSAIRQMRLARARRPQEDDVLLRHHEVELAEVGDDVAAHRALVLEVELVEALAGGEAGGPDPGLAAMAGPRGDLALEAGREVRLVAPALVPGALGEAGARVEEGRRLERPAEVGQVRSRRGQAHGTTSKARS
jgi:hypothetical protein